MTKLFVGVICLLNFHSSFGQNFTTFKTASKKVQGQYQQAMNFIAQQEYEHATEALEESVASDEKFIDGWLLLGELYNTISDFSKGKSALQRTIELGPDFASKAYFFLAESCWNTDDFAGCLAAAEKFLTFKDISIARKKVAEQFVENSRFAVIAVQHPVPFDPKSLGNEVNSTYAEYLPSLTGDESQIVFTRRVGEGKYAQEDFYSSYKKNNQWTPAQPLSDDINSDFNEGAQCMTPDGNTIYYVACNRPGGLGNCDIYFTNRNGNNWTIPKNIGTPINGNTWETQPTISADGRTLIFVSERGGTKGESDLWISTRDESGKWSVPQNMGDSINTMHDEMSPFFHPDGQTLYFASDGWPGMGKHDIFYSRKKTDGTWSQPMNIGYPINSKNDDNCLVVSLDGRHAFFSSDRFKGNFDMDLYEFELYEAVRPVPSTFVRGVITDATSGFPLVADVQLLDLETGELIAASTSEAANGFYLVSIPSGKDYALNVSSPGYLFYSEHFSLAGDHPGQPYEMNVSLHVADVGTSVILKNIFFTTDSYDLKEESFVELKKLISLLQKNPQMKIEIGGHTDNVGSDDYNIQLSTNWAKAVINYLVTNGINSARLNFKGYGESKPIAGNETEEGRALNRRTEFTVTAN